MSNQIELLSKLRKQLLAFLDELIQSFPNEADFVVFRLFVDNKIPIADIMNYIVAKILPLKKSVAERNDTFFLGNNILFEQADNNKVNHFKKLWMSPDVDDDDKAVIWQWFDSFISIAEEYQKC